MLLKTKSRLLSPFEKKYSDTLIQLSIEFEKQTEIQKNVEKLLKYSVPLHTRIEGERLVYTNDINVFKMPKIEKISDSCDWILKKQKKMQIEDNKSFPAAIIAYNDKFITFSSQHLCCDGGYFKNMIKLIQNDEEIEKTPWEYLSIPGDFILKDTLKSIDPNIIYNSKKETTHILSREENFERHKDQCVRASTLLINGKKIKCYGNGKIQKLTDSLWSSLLLSMTAYNCNKKSDSSDDSEEINQNFQKIDDLILPKTIGTATCIDLRDRFLLPKKLHSTWGVSNFLSILSHSAQLNKKDSIGKIGQRLRESLKERIQKGHLPSYFLYNRDQTKVNGSAAEVSNVGPIFISNPIKDVFMQINYNDPIDSALLSLLSWSVISQEKNEIALRLRYQPSWLHDYEADTICASVKFALEELPLDMNVIEAIKEIMSFQEGFLRTTKDKS